MKRKNITMKEEKKMSKYKLTKTKKEYFGKTLYQIEAVANFGNISKGDKGGYIEKESNLSQSGDAWVFDNAKVFDNAEVSGNAKVFGDAWVFGDAEVFGNAEVFGDAWVFDNAEVSGDAEVFGSAKVFGKLKLLAGFFFGIRYKKEEIKFVKIDDKYELIYKGEAKFGEDKKERL